MNKIIYIPIEVQRREWMAKMYLAYKLLEKGYPVIIGEYVRIHQFAVTRKNGIFLDSHFFYWLDDYYKMKENGYSLLLSDEEAVIAGGISDYQKQRIDKNNLEIADVLMAWGKQHADAIKGVDESIGDKLVIVGNPRIDLLRKELRGIWKEKIDNIHKRYGQYILINTSFSYATCPGQYEKDCDTYNSMLSDSKEAIKLLDKQFKQFNDTFNQFIEGIQYFAKKIEKPIIIRPHPNEDIELYRKLFKQYNNVYVLNEGEINPWILGAKLVIHNSCTTGMEAFIAGTPTIAYMPRGLYCYEDAISNEISLKITDKETLVAEGKQIIENRLDEKELEKKYFSEECYRKLGEHILFDKKESATEKIVGYIEKMEDDSAEEFKLSTINKSLFFLKDIFYYLLRTMNENYKWKDVNYIEIKRIMKKFCKVTGEIMDIKVQPLGYRLYLLKRSK